MGERRRAAASAGRPGVRAGKDSARGAGSVPAGSPPGDVTGTRNSSVPRRAACAKTTFSASWPSGKNSWLNPTRWTSPHQRQTPRATSRPPTRPARSTKISRRRSSPSRPSTSRFNTRWRRSATRATAFGREPGPSVGEDATRPGDRQAQGRAVAEPEDGRALETDLCGREEAVAGAGGRRRGRAGERPRGHRSGSGDVPGQAVGQAQFQVRPGHVVRESG